ncbi:hypothetical protein BU17DRAFT_75560 [Hysterangium stoloniferum]|nr:hypothetical protein BU17DRAFT_75560 [Hysterangium stoloniferum]
MHAIQSFENLVALANDQERLKDARKMVWRDRGEPAVELATIRECLMHAARGGLRAGTLAFAIRSGFNLFVLLFRIWKLPRGFRLSLIRRALFGEDSFRFGAMLGTFVALYKYILNALPLLNLNFNFNLPFHFLSSSPTHPTTFHKDDENDADTDMNDDVDMGAMRAMRTSHASRRLSTQAKAHQEWVRKRTKRWHAIVAGAVAGGLSLLFEKKRRRVTIAQQLFVRGLQGSYNEFTTRHGIKVPFGAVILFGVCSGQILYAFLLRPDTIPAGYNDWIQKASKVLPETIRINMSLVREGNFKLEDIEGVLKWELRRARDLGDFGPHFASCAVVHPWLPSCKSVPVDRFVSVWKWSFPIYGALHFIPMILFKRHQFLKEPGRMLFRALTGTARSSTFLGAFVIIYQTYFCLKHNFNLHLTSLNAPIKLPKFITDILIGKLSFWLGGLLSGLSLFIEAKHRRQELAMYVLPKGLESAWKVGRGKGFVVGPRKHGEAMLCALGMGMVMLITVQHNPQHLSGLVRRILYQFIGPN